MEVRFIFAQFLDNSRIAIDNDSEHLIIASSVIGMNLVDNFLTIGGNFFSKIIL